MVIMISSECCCVFSLFCCRSLLLCIFYCLCVCVCVCVLYHHRHQVWSTVSLFRESESLLSPGSSYFCTFELTQHFKTTYIETLKVFFKEQIKIIYSYLSN